MKFVRYLSDVVRYFGLPRQARRLTFYSEGTNYWSYLEPLLTEVLAVSDVPVCYVSSDEHDPGLLVDHHNVRKFLIDDRFVRDWVFRNIETDVLVMTMPDLHQYQVKRSRHPVHYVYVQHSLVSLHMVYRKGAFDHYDTVFCAGPHHLKEIRAMEAEFNLPSKSLYAHGYGRFDKLLRKSASGRRKETPSRAGLHVLIAPSWGPRGMIESGIGETIVACLLQQEMRVTLRPHPQTLKFAPNQVNAILDQHRHNPLFAHESNVVGQDALLDSDVMVSDWSGAALEYMLALRKPVLYVDVPMKVNNPDFRRIALEPLERVLRKSHRSDILELNEIALVAEKIEELVSRAVDACLDVDDVVFNPGESARHGARRVLEILAELEQSRKIQQ